MGLEIKRDALVRLKNAGVPNPMWDIERFLTHLERNQTALIQNSDDFLSMIDRRCLREPVERILGYSSFYEKEYRLHQSVFRPILETETTVEYALQCARKFSRPVRILDLGCGNGCMLISMLLQLKDATGVGVDLNPEAIKLSIENAETHMVQGRTQFIVSDWANDLNEKFDIIISNPPRIAHKHLDKLALEVSRYDPTESLNGGQDGLVFYRRTIEAIPKLSNPDCYIVMQAGKIISQTALNIFQSAGYRDIQLGRDFKSLPNCIVLSNKLYLKKYWASKMYSMLINSIKGKLRKNHDILHNQ